MRKRFFLYKENMLFWYSGRGCLEAAGEPLSCKTQFPF